MTDRAQPSQLTVWRRRIATIAWGVAVWCALWGDVSVANLLWGAVLTTAVLVILPVSPSELGLIRPVAAARFGLWFVWALIRSSGAVAWAAIRPRPNLDEGIIALPLATDAPGIVTLIANTISLTPGTLTLEVRQDPPTLYVHVLHLHDLDGVREELDELQRLACATVGIDTTASDDRVRPDHDAGDRR